ncbi:hypothetical protein [Streptomyces aculeolatus]|uniref:hypothetical protein n=1 Tax=Streptomyces aculeolatus TaxID=270689 RepID=UPI001CECFBD0|nr:hypothetical protein [Streptomyces aculeolatus]
MAEQWAGRTFSKNMRFNDLFGAGYTAHGDFTFTVGEDGEVSGQAAVAYELIVDVGRMNTIIEYVREKGQEVLGGLGPVGIALGSIGEFGRLMRVGYETEQQLTILSGPISGAMISDTLKLQWSARKQRDFKGIPLRVYYEHQDKKDPISKNPLSVESPWPGEANVDQWQAMTAYQSPASKGDTKTETSAYWTAHRVG